MDRHPEEADTGHVPDQEVNEHRGGMREKTGGGPTSDTPAHESTAAAAPFRA